MGFLLVGDVHATPDDLEDCERLIDGLVDFSGLSGAAGVDKVVFMGDLFHTHATLNVHVVDFWTRSFKRLRQVYSDVICLVGNHDFPGNTGNTTVNALSVFDGPVTVIHDHAVVDGVLFVAYKYSNDEFVKICNKNCDIKYVLCHQTFNGAKFENGFLAPDGVDLDRLPENQEYVSGHIHKIQAFDRVSYVGSTRWRTASDANEEKALFWLKNGRLSKSHDLAFGKQRIIVAIDSYETAPFVLNFHYDYDGKRKTTYMNLHGSKQWVDTEAEKWIGQAIVKKFYNTVKTVKVKESEGIDTALATYINSTTLKTPKEELLQMVKERIWMI